MGSNWSGKRLPIRKFENRDFKKRFVSGCGLHAMIK